MSTITAYVVASRRQSDPAMFRELVIVCLWTACGCALSALLFAAGFATEIATALASAG